MAFLIKNKSRQSIPVLIDTGESVLVQYNLTPIGRGSFVKSKSITPNMETLQKNKFITISQVD